jgi:hypothetical protein
MYCKYAMPELEGREHRIVCRGRDGTYRKSGTWAINTVVCNPEDQRSFDSPRPVLSRLIAFHHDCKVPLPASRLLSSSLPPRCPPSFGRHRACSLPFSLLGLVSSLSAQLRCGPFISTFTTVPTYQWLCAEGMIGTGVMRHRYGCRVLE